MPISIPTVSPSTIMDASTIAASMGKLIASI
jgi:hypothetical protein